MRISFSTCDVASAGKFANVIEIDDWKKKKSSIEISGYTF